MNKVNSVRTKPDQANSFRLVVQTGRDQAKERWTLVVFRLRKKVSKEWQVILAKLARIYKITNTWLSVYYKLCARTGFDLPETPPQTVSLPSDEILRLSRKDRISHVRVIHGTIWLTGSPANGDILLGAGDQFELPGNWPFVLQALGRASVELIRNSSQSVERGTMSGTGRKLSVCSEASFRAP